MNADEAYELIADIDLIVQKYGTASSGNWGHAGVIGQLGGSAPSGGPFNQTDIKVGGRTFAIYRNTETTITTSSDIIAHTLQTIPKREIEASACERIEVYDNPEDVVSRLNDLGFDDTDYAMGAYVPETRTIYTSIYNPDLEENTNRNFIHEFGHSVVGTDEERAEEFVKSYSGLVKTYDWNADPASQGIERATKGGAGSGNFNHESVPGHRGGSAPATTATVSDYYEPPTSNRGFVDDLDADGAGDATEQAKVYGIEGEWRVFNSANQDWTRGAKQDAKQEIYDRLTKSDGVREMTLYETYSSDVQAGRTDGTFKDWLDTPQTYYRGGGMSYPFMSFSSSDRVAADASKTDMLHSVRMAPSQLLGSAMTGGGEVYVDSEAIETLGPSYQYKGSSDDGNEIVSPLTNDEIDAAYRAEVAERDTARAKSNARVQARLDGATKESNALDLAYDIELILAASKAAVPELKIVRNLSAQLRKLFKSIEKETRSKVQSTNTPEEIAPILKKILEKNRPAFVRIIQNKRKTAFYAGIKHSKRIAAKKALLKNPIAEILIRMLAKSFIASNDTMDRITGDVMSTLAKGFVEEKGTYDVARMLEKVFEGISPERADLIARTEINGAQNQGAFEQFKEMEVEYQQWWTAEDERVRDGTNGSADHVAMHGQIVAVGDTFNNGLLYPGDTDGDIGEWINCRCTTVPYLMPWGFKAPDDMQQFYEGDIVQVDSEKSAQKYGTAESGNHGHAGRIGIRGGSAPGDGGRSSLKIPGNHSKMDYKTSPIFQRFLQPNCNRVDERNLLIREQSRNMIDMQQGDPVLHAMQEEQGFAELPSRVSDEQFDQLVKDSPYGRLYRGEKDPEYVDEFKNGKLHTGIGVSGDGTYFAAATDESNNQLPGSEGWTPEIAYEVARAFSGLDPDKDRIMETVLKPDAKVVNFKTLTVEHRELEGKLLDKMDNPEYYEQAHMMEYIMTDPGRYATYMGYDAIYIEDESFVVLLNRGAICIPERKFPVPVKGST